MKPGELIGMTEHGDKVYALDAPSSVAQSASSDSASATRMKDTVDALAKALLEVEWSGSFRLDYDIDAPCCPSCQGLPSPLENTHGAIVSVGHSENCAIEAALKKAGVR